MLDTRHRYEHFVAGTGLLSRRLMMCPIRHDLVVAVAPDRFVGHDTDFLQVAEIARSLDLVRPQTQVEGPACSPRLFHVKLLVINKGLLEASSTALFIGRRLDVTFVIQVPWLNG